MGRVLYKVAQFLGFIVVILFSVGLFPGDNKQYIQDIGSFILAFVMLILIVSNKSDGEDEYDKILRKVVMTFCALGVIGIPVAYFIKLVLY